MGLEPTTFCMASASGGLRLVSPFLQTVDYSQTGPVAAAR